MKGQELEKMFSGYEGNPLPTYSVNGAKGRTSLKITDLSGKYELRIQMCASFAYTLSRFTGYTSSAFIVKDSDRTSPLLIPTSDRLIREYISIVEETLDAAGEFEIDISALTDSAQSISRLVLSVDGVLDEEADLSLSYSINDGVVFVDLNHSDIYSIKFANTFLSVFARILTGFKTVSRLSEIKYTPEEDLIYLDRMNDNAMPIPYGDIIEALKRHVSDSPGRCMVRFLDRSYNYSEAYFLTGGIASALSEFGVKNGDPVGLFMPRCEWIVIATFAVLRSGGAYVPIDVAHPDDSIRDILEDCHLKVVVTIAQYADRIRNIRPDLLIITADTMKGCEFVNPTYSLDDTGLILYTSGTTGKPKGVVHRRRITMNPMLGYIRELEFNENTVFSLFTNLGFAMHISALFGTICMGGCIDIMPDDIRRDMHGMEAYFKSHGITHTFLTPSIAKSLIAATRSRNLPIIYMGGEPIGDMAPEFIDRFGVIYGCTENPDIAFCPLAKRSDNKIVGPLIPNVRGYILDAEGRRVPLGAAGILHTSGLSTFVGYLNNEKLTAEKLKVNSFCSDEHYDRLFTVGDIAVVMEDGTISILGRWDGQIKIRGNRVEVTDIESLIRELDFVSGVTVQALKNDAGMTELVAYIITDRKDFDFKGFVGSKRPEYMVPAHIMFLDSIPLNINGKVDRKALPQPDRTAGRQVFVAPRSEEEKILCSIFGKVLGISDFGIDDDFVTLGGNSLNAIDAQSRMDGLTTVSSILKYRTPREIAEKGLCSQEDLVNPYTVSTGCPLTGDQKTIYMDIVLNDKSSAYNMDFKFDFGNHTCKEVESALRIVIDAHPVLKARIQEKDAGEPWLVCDSYPDIELIEFLPAISELVRPFDIMKGPICRFYISSDGSVSGAVNHLVFDGMSIRVLEKEIETVLSEGRIKDDEGFLKIAAREKSVKESGNWGEYEHYYENVFSDYVDDPHPVSSPDGEGGCSYRSLWATRKELETYALTIGISSYDILTSAFAYTLSRFSGTSDIMFCTVENGRDFGDLSKSIGMFAKTLPHRIDCSDRPVSEYLLKASESFEELKKYSAYPFRSVAERFDIRSDIVFQYRANIVAKPIDTEEVMIDGRSVEVKIERMRVNDILCCIYDKGDGFEIGVEHSSMYSSGFADRFAETYDLVLSSFLRCRELHEVECLPEKDRLLMDSVFGDRKTSYEDVVQAFEHWLSDDPDRIFVVHDRSEYTYRQAARRIGGLTAKLKKAGVSPGDFVALSLPVGEWFMFAPLGVLSAGGAYASFDLSYPDDRLKTMFDSICPKAVVTIRDNTERLSGLTDAEIITIEDLEEAPLEPVSVNPDSYAFITFTSGTTGIPKSVTHRRRDIMLCADSYIAADHLERDGRSGMYGGLGFVAHVSTIYSAVVAGRILDIIPKHVRGNIRLLADYIKAHNITHIDWTTSMARLFLSTCGMCTLKTVNIGAEPIGTFDEEFRDRLVATYGSSECMQTICSVDMNRRCHDSEVGFPCKNVRVYVLDKEKRRVPIGAVGEVHVAALQLTPGYLNDDRRNAEFFFSNTFDDTPGFERIYNTGDMGTILPDGSLGLIGRRDTQVKIRGNRVELTEVESSIRKCSDILAVTAQSIVLESGIEVLVAYVVPKDGSAVDEQFVKDMVAREKPAYMVPSYIVTLDAIPLNQNGKVNKHALPKPDTEVYRQKYIAPRNETEVELCNAFSKILGIEKVGIDDSFLNLGGDSLKAIAVRGLLSDLVSTTDILRLCTPRRISESMIRLEYDPERYDLSGCPLTESQLNVYLDQEVNAKGSAYNIRFTAVLEGKDIEESMKIVSAVIETYPILKGRIEDRDRPYLVCDSYPEFVDDPSVMDDPLEIHKNLCRFCLIPETGGIRVECTVHHTISDGLSRDIIKRAILSGITKPGEPDLGFLRAASYDEYLREPGRMADARKFFEKVFSDVDTDSGLLLDVNGAPGITTVILSVTKNQIDQYARSHGLANGVFMASVFAYALSRYTGRSDAVFCDIDNGRDIGNLDASVGMFVKTLPLSIDCSDHDVDGFVKAASMKIYDTMKYGSYPFRNLFNDYGVKADITFQYTAGFIDIPIEDLKEGSIDLPENNTGLTNEVSADIMGSGDVLLLSMLHTARYSHSTMARLAHVYDRILQEIIGGVEKLSDIAYISPEDIETEDGYNRTEKALRFDDILDAFADSVRQRPNMPYVTYRDITVTYSEADALTEAIAGRLSEIGIEPGDSVASYVTRSEWYGLAVIGILKARAVYVPIEETYPDERIEFMIRDASSKAILVSSETAERAGRLSDKPLIDVTELKAGGLICRNADPDDIALILYTSGTTGQPKGALISRRSVANFSEWYVSYTGSDEKDRFCMYASYGFDAHMIPICAALFSGGCLDIVPEEIRFDMQAFNEHILEKGITELFLPTSMGRMFVLTQRNGLLRHLMIGGEASGDLITDQQYILIDGYGPTENFIFTCVSDTKGRYPSSVGYPLINNKIYILDKERRRVPFGAVGELYIAGHQLAREYLNRPDMNDTAFSMNTFESDPLYRTLYSTGDYVRYLPDGTIQILGRRDGQVKIRGNRVELTEVESVISSMEGIRRISVQPIINEKGGKELCAYVVMEEGATLEAGDIKTFVSDRKPAYMVPLYIIFLEDIPLNINGKVDRRALPKPDMTTSEYTAPRNETEDIICHAFQEALSIEKIGIDDDFGRLGGDSVKAINVVSFCHSAGIKVTASEIIRRGTVRSLAEIVEKTEYNDAVVTGEAELPPTLRMFKEFVTHKDCFDQCMMLESAEKIDAVAMQKAVNMLTDHHDMLRASVTDKISIMEAGGQVCKILKLKGDIGEAVSKVRRGLNIANGKVISCGILRGPEQNLLIISVSHVAVDAVSWNIILDDLTSLYEATKNGIEYRFPSKTMSYLDWAANAIGYASGCNRKELLYWTDQCSGLRGAVRGKSVRTFVRRADIDLQPLRNNPYCASIEEILLTAYARAYCKVTSSDGFSVAMEGHGRESLFGEVSRTVGWFTCIYPLNIGRVGEDIDKDIRRVLIKRRKVPNNGIGYGSFRLDTSFEMDRDLPPASFNYLSDMMTYSGRGFVSKQLPPSDDRYSDIMVHGFSLNVFNENGAVSMLCYSDTGTELDRVAEDIAEEFSVQLKAIADYCEGKMVAHAFECPLSFASMNVILDESKSDMGNAYNSPNILNMPVGTSVERLREAVGKVIEAHPVLRLRITIKDGEPWFVCDSEPEIRMIEGDPDYEEFNRRFDFYRNISRFWIVSRGEDVSLLMNIHHLAVDNYSIGNLRKDILNAYEGKEIPFDLGFIMASNSDRCAEDSIQYQNAIDFFEGMFADADTDSSLIGDVGDREACDVMRKVEVSSESIENLAKRSGTTVSSLFASVYAYTLSRFTGRTDSIFCFMENGRNTRQLENSVGMFAKILPIRIDCSDAPVTEFIGNAGRRMLDAISHDCYPFYEAARRFNVNGSIQFQYVPSQNFFETFQSDMGKRSKVLTDFDFNIMYENGSYYMFLVCSPKYSKETAERFIDAYSMILDGFLTKERLSDIEYISQADREVLDRYNSTSRPLICGNIREWFDKCVREGPEDILVKYNDRKITYSEAERITGTIASVLVSKGVRKGDKVAVLVPRSEWYVLAPIGVIRAGATYVPIDSSYPDERVTHMIKDSFSVAVVAFGDLIERAESLELGIDVIDIESMTGNVSFTDVPVDPLDPCVILYTSGTTGKPKGSVITHRAVVNMCEWYIDYTKMNEKDCYGFYTSIAFDIHTMAVFAPLVCRASIDVVPEEVRLDMSRLNDHYVTQNVTHTFITTQVGKLFAASNFDTTIRFLLYGGEKLGVFTAPDNVGACESYGPSENLSLSTAIYVNDRKDPSSVGYLLPNIKAYILDAEKRLVPNGAVGELHLAGYQLSTGYLNRDEINQTVFIPNTYSDEPGYERLYATGDFFRWLPDGTLGVLGRRDGQLKIRGNRVEVTEVDEVIRSIDKVKDVTVQPIVNDSGGKELCAYVVLEPGAILLAQDIKTYVSERKPAYMVPAYVMFLNAIPLTVNAKVDKKNLPKPDKSTLRAEYVAPRNGKEKIFCEAFSEILKVDNVGIDDDFILLGGDSIKAIRLLPFLQNSGLDTMGITPADILSFRTIRTIMSKAVETIKVPELYHYSTGCPLTDSQRSMYEYIRRNPEFWHNLPFSVSREDWTDAESIRRNLYALMILFPVLTSRIIEKDGEPIVVFDDEPDIPIVYADPEEVQKNFIQWFDIRGQPLCRYVLCEWMGRVTLFQDYHHLIFDGRSIAVILNTIKKIMEGDRPLLDDGILRVSAYDTTMKGTERYLRSKAIVEAELEGSCDDYLPYRMSENEGSVVRHITVKGDVIRKYITEHRLSVAGFLSAALGCTFSEMSGKDKCLFFLTEDGRGHLPLEESVCLYAKGIPVAASVRGKTYSQIAEDVSKHVFENMSYDEYAVWEMMRDHDVKWNIRLQYANYYIMDEDLIKGKFVNLKDVNQAITDLWIMVREKAEDFVIFILHSRKFSQEQTEEIAKRFDDMITRIITENEDRL